MFVCTDIINIYITKNMVYDHKIQRSYDTPDFVTKPLLLATDILCIIVVNKFCYLIKNPQGTDSHLS